MNATKRKFNALLQGIGTRSPNSASNEKNKRSSVASAPSSPCTKGSPRSSVSTTRTDVGKPGSVPDMSNTVTSPVAARTAPAATATSKTTATAPKTAAAELEFLAKRRRIGATVTLRDTSGNATVTTSNSILRKWAGSGASGVSAVGNGSRTGAPEPAPRYCPGDREQLLRRLATFQELTDWTPKPDRINEIEWAKRGWVCQGKERLRCTLCSKELVVRLGRLSGDSSGASAGVGAEDALVDRYASLIVNAHEEDCLWLRKGCDDTLLRLSLANPRQALTALRERYDELCARKDFLPYEINLRLPAGFDVDAVLAALPPDFFAASFLSTATAPTFASTSRSKSTPAPEPAPPPTPNRVALALATLGWQGLTNSRIGAVPNSASCHTCLRRLGLWMFKSKQIDPATNTVLEPAPMDGLDAVREHRFFCPWKNGAVQRNPGGKSGRASASAEADADSAGWAVMVQLLRNEAYLRNRTTPGGGVRRHRDGSAGTPTKAGRTAAAASGTVTPVRRTASGADEDALEGDAPGEAEAEAEAGAEVEDEADRTAKDKERWARLRRVKSLFDSKGSASRKQRRAGTPSRPGTAQSTRPESRAERSKESE